MEKEVFGNDSFKKFAGSHLEMVNADFPRLGKHKLDENLAKQNDALAEKYDKDGHFPYTVLLTSDGKVLKTWEGYTGSKPAEYIAEISSFINAN